jgi:hypothetical protein
LRIMNDSNPLFTLRYNLSPILSDKSLSMTKGDQQNLSFETLVRLSVFRREEKNVSKATKQELVVERNEQ